jgi:predicted O-methyltransferase YrrM
MQKHIKDIIQFVENFNYNDFEKELKELKNKFDSLKYKNLSSENIFYDHVFLSHLLKLLEQKRNALYLEAGVFWGRSLFVSAMAAPSVMCYGVDNNTMSGQQIFTENMQKHHLPNLGYLNSKFQDFFDSHYSQALRSRKIDLYLYDGDHSYESQYEGLSKAVRHLSDEAIILVDDAALGINNLEPYTATMDFVSKNCDNVKVIRCLDKNDGISIGIICLYYNKSGV